MDDLKHSAGKPIQIDSDSLAIRQKEGIAILSGNVNVVQGDTILKADRMVVHYNNKGVDPIGGGDTDIDTIDMSGNVFLSFGTKEATAETGHFDVDEQSFVLQGERVVLTDSGNVLVGCKLTIHMMTAEAKLDSCGRRVRIQIDPKSRQKQ